MKKAQSLAEYTIIVGIIITSLVIMATPFRRTIQRVIKDVADLIGLQSESEQASSNITQGFLDQSVTDLATRSTEIRRENEEVYEVESLREVLIKSESNTNLGASW